MAFKMTSLPEELCIFLYDFSLLLTVRTQIILGLINNN